MGEDKKLFPIPAYLEFDDVRLKVLELGVKGVLLEWNEALRSLESPDGKGVEFTADFIFPYDGYSEIVLKNVSLRCEDLKLGESGEPPKTVFCSFVNLSKEQEEFFRLLVRDYLWRRIISIPSEFMNYTQDEDVRKELLSIQKNIELKKRLKRIAFLAVASSVILFAGLTPMIVKFFFERGTSLTVRYVEEERNGSIKLKQPATSLKAASGAEEEKGVVKESHETFAAEAPSGVKKDEVKEKPQPLLPSNSEEKPKKEVAKAAVEVGIVASHLKNQSPTATYEVVEASAEKEQEELPYLSSTAPELVKSSSPSLPAQPEADKTFYCVQVASDFKPSGLVKIAEKLVSQYPAVRVEKIGKAYTLRVGFFEDSSQARDLARKLKTVEPKAFWRTCAYKPERWVYPKEG